VVPIELHLEDAAVVIRFSSKSMNAGATPALFQEYFTWEALAGAVEHSFVAFNFSYEERPEKFSLAGFVSRF